MAEHVVVAYAAKVVLQLPLSDPARLAPFVEACVRDGVKLIAVAGEGCADIEDAIDDLVVGDGSDRRRFIVTTSHPGEGLDEVLKFATDWMIDPPGEAQLVKL